LIGTTLLTSIALIATILLAFGARAVRKSRRIDQSRFAPEDLMRRAQIKLFECDGLGVETLLADCTTRFPKDPGVWWTLGSAKVLLKKIDEALSAYRIAMELAPTDPTPHSLAAMTLHSIGRDLDALAECRTAISLGSPDPYIRELIIEIETSVHGLGRTT
jgi:hypothetical protein